MKKLNGKPKAEVRYVGIKQNLARCGRGQATVIYTALLGFNAKGATEAELVSAVRKKLKLHANREATPRSCVHAHLRQFVREKMVKVETGR